MVDKTPPIEGIIYQNDAVTKDPLDCTPVDLFLPGHDIGVLERDRLSDVSLNAFEILRCHNCIKI